MVAIPPLAALIAHGRWGNVRAVVCSNGKNWTFEFLDNELEPLIVDKDPVTTARDRCLEWFALLAEEGTLPSKRFRNEAASFLSCCFEIRNKQIRFPCFRDGNEWIVTHGFFKPGAKKGLGKWPPEQVERAVRLRNEYKQRKQFLQGLRANEKHPRG